MVVLGFERWVGIVVLCLGLLLGFVVDCCFVWIFGWLVGLTLDDLLFYLFVFFGLTILIVCIYVGGFACFTLFVSVLDWLCIVLRLAVYCFIVVLVVCCCLVVDRLWNYVLVNSVVSTWWCCLPGIICLLFSIWCLWWVVRCLVVLWICLWCLV